MSDSPKEIMAQEIYDTLKHWDIEDARADADSIIEALEREGYEIKKVEKPAPSAKPAEPRT